MTEYREAIYVLPDAAKKINELTGLTGKETYDKYGYKFGETIVYTAKFPDGKEMDIKLCISDEDSTNWCDAVLFNENGYEICCSDVGEEFFGEWELEHDDVKYIVNILVLA